MGFPENIKRMAKERGHYACSWCGRRDLFLQVHHIKPQAEGGPDTIENAAPLCVGCHDEIGGHPGRKKQLLERRDWLWERCQAEERRPDLGPLYLEIRPALEKIDTLTETVLSGQRTQEDSMVELKRAVVELQEIQLRQASSATTVEEVMFAIGSYTGKGFGTLRPVEGNASGHYDAPSNRSVGHDEP